MRGPDEVDAVVNHADVRAKLADYLEGHLALTERALLDAHLDGCPDCAAEVAEMRATIGALRSLPEPLVPGDFTANVMRRVRAGEAEPGFLDRLGHFFESLLSPRVLAPLSAAALSAGFVLWGQQAGVISVPGLELPTEPAAEVVAVAQTEATRPSAGATSAAPDVTLVSRDDGANRRYAGDSVLVTEAGDGRSVVTFEVVFSDDARPPYATATPRGVFTPAPMAEPWPATRSPWRSNEGGSMAVAHDGAGTSRPSAGGEQPSRDDWLAMLEASPALFAERMSRRTLAEQELWVENLARHAIEQGSIDRVIDRLENAGGAEGRMLAADFAAVRAEAASSGGEAPPR